MDSEDHPFLTARHVDDLKESVRSLNIAIGGLSKVQADILETLKIIAFNTSNLPALMDVLMSTKTNGGLQDAADRTEP